mgnify:CR=1 FL=1
MPAAVYWFGGLLLASGSNAVSIPVLVAFTTLQTRLFFPVGSLLGVSLDVQTSLALFDRIFEYLDQPIDIEREARCDHVGAGRRRRLRPRLVPLRRRLDAARTSRSPVPPGRRPRSSARPAPERRPSATSRRGCTTSAAGSVTIGGVDVARPELPGADAISSGSSRRRRTSSTPRCARTCASPSPTRPTKSSRQAARGGADPRRDRGAAGGLRHRRRRARLPLLRRREAADRDRADDPAQPADPRPRRGDELARHRDRAARCRRRSTVSRRGGRRSRSRTDSRRSATPTRSSCSITDAIVERGRHEELLRAGGRYATLAARDAELETPAVAGLAGAS